MLEIIQDENNIDYQISNRPIYLDQAASSDPEPEVYVDMCMQIIHSWYNPSSQYQPAKDVRNQINEARNKVRNFLNAHDNGQIIFGSCASEMIALGLNSNNCIISTYIEHPTLYNRDQNEMKIKTDRFGRIDLNKLESALQFLSGCRKIVAFAGVNSEIGIIQPIEKIVKLAHKYNALVLVDWCQGAAHYPINVQDYDIDMLVMTSEKIGSIRGTGVLYVREGLKATPLWYGGSQESETRPGTENSYSIVAFANQLERIYNSWEERISKEHYIRGMLMNAIYNACENICDWNTFPFNKENTNQEEIKTLDYVSNILSVIFKGIDNQQLLTLLDLHNVYASAGSACSSHKRKPSRVLLNIGLTEDEANNVIRFSFDYRLKDEEIEEFGKRLRRCLLAIKNTMED